MTTWLEFITEVLFGRQAPARTPIEVIIPRETTGLPGEFSTGKLKRVIKGDKSSGQVRRNGMTHGKNGSTGHPNVRRRIEVQTPVASSATEDNQDMVGSIKPENITTMEQAEAYQQQLLNAGAEKANVGVLSDAGNEVFVGAAAAALEQEGASVEANESTPIIESVEDPNNQSLAERVAVATGVAPKAKLRGRAGADGQLTIVEPTRKKTTPIVKKEKTVLVPGDDDDDVVTTPGKFGRFDHLTGDSVEPFRPHVFQTKLSFFRKPVAPKILITPQAYGDMVAIGSWSGNDEIGWLGSVEKVSENSYLITEVFLVDQEVHGSTTKITEDGLADFICANPELNEKLLFWGHVHPSNSTSPSPQDEEQMESFTHNDWFIRGIFGREGRAEFTFFDYKNKVRFNDCPWQVVFTVDEARKQYWKEEVEKHVTKQWGMGYGNYGSNYGGGSGLGYGGYQPGGYRSTGRGGSASTGTGTFQRQTWNQEEID